MKITQKQAINAYRVVRKLEMQEMPGIYAKKLFDMRRALEPQFQFQNEQEQKICQALGCRIEDDGTIQFPDVTSKKTYLDKLAEVFALDVDIAGDKQSFNVSDLRLSATDLEYLEPIFDIVC